MSSVEPAESSQAKGARTSAASSRPAQCEPNCASKSSEHPMTHTSKGHLNHLNHNHLDHQQLLHQLNRHECGSNQSGSDSGLGHTNSISSENSSLIANATSLEQIAAHNNGKSVDRREIGVSKLAAVVGKSDGQQQSMARVDSPDEGAQSSACSNEDTASLRPQSGKTDAAAASSAQALANDDLHSDSHRNGAQQHLYGNERPPAAKSSVRVSESAGNNVTQSNQDNGGALPATRTKSGPGRESAAAARESSTNSAKVINNTEDEAKIKHSAKCGTNHHQHTNHLANSTIRPHGTDNEPPDSLAGHEIHSATLSASAHERPVQRINPIVSSSSPPPPVSGGLGALPLIKSSLKKTIAVDAPNKRPAKHNRNVSFNQTVIVFCEEIETSSSETFEPPLDYQDDSFGEPEMPAAVAANYKDGSIRGDARGHASDDFDILSKIVCDDASSLTDDQLIGLLENGSLLKKFDLDETDKALAIDRINSDQGYLCHDAMSDSESESSLTTDIRLGETRPVVVVASDKQAPAKAKETANAKRSASSQASSGNEPSESSLERHSSSQTVKAHFGAHAETNSMIVSTQQNRSMPARVKVSTVDDHLRRPPHKPSAAQADDNESSSKCACPTLGQGNKQAKSEPPILVRLTSAQPAAAFSRPQARETEDTARRQIQFEHGKDCSLQGAIGKTGNGSLVACQDQISSRESQLDAGASQNKASPNSPSQPANVISAQIIQSNQACHICRAIESNLNQAKIGPRGERTSLATSIGGPAPPHFERASEPPPPQLQTARSANMQNHGPIECQPARQTQLGAPNQTSCVSCRELSVRQRPKQQQQQQQTPAAQLVRPNPTGNPLDHQQVKPIACQLVYVVDQNGNRMRALQVVNPAQMGLHNTQVRPLAVGNCRQPAPNGGQNLYCVLNQASQPMVGVVRSVPNQTSPHSAQATSSSSQYAPMRDTPMQAPINQRLELVNHSAPKNHVVYYVRQPLCPQDLQQASSVPNPMARTFPDVHEIRRLDGIRGPTESPSLMQTMNQPRDSSGRISNELDLRPQAKVEDQPSRFRRDDSEDPSFGFSSRPAVKVVANTARDSQPAVGLVNGLSHMTTIASNSNLRSLAGSQTLDRKIVNRDRSGQRDAKENIPGTSSMSNINRTLANYVDSTNNATAYRDDLKSKEIDVDHLRDRNNFQLQTSHQADGSGGQLRPDKRDQNRSDVAYIMNI